MDLNRKDRGRKYNDKSFYEVPLFKIYPYDFNDQKPVFVDQDLKTYNDFFEYLEKNNLPDGYIIFPKDGSYTWDRHKKEVHLDLLTLKRRSVTRFTGKTVQIFADILSYLHQLAYEVWQAFIKKAKEIGINFYNIGKKVFPFMKKHPVLIASGVGVAVISAILLASEGFALGVTSRIPIIETLSSLIGFAGSNKEKLMNVVQFKSVLIYFNNVYAKTSALMSYMNEQFWTSMNSLKNMVEMFGSSIKSKALVELKSFPDFLKRMLLDAVFADENIIPLLKIFQETVDRLSNSSSWSEVMTIFKEEIIKVLNTIILKVKYTNSGEENTNSGKENTNSGKENTNSGKENTNSGKENTNSGKENTNSGKENTNSGEENTNSGKENTNTYGHFAAFTDDRKYFQPKSSEKGQYEDDIQKITVGLIKTLENKDLPIEQFLLKKKFVRYYIFFKTCEELSKQADPHVDQNQYSTIYKNILTKTKEEVQTNDKEKDIFIQYTKWTGENGNHKEFTLLHKDKNTSLYAFPCQEYMHINNVCYNIFKTTDYTVNKLDDSNYGVSIGSNGAFITLHLGEDRSLGLAYVYNI